MTKVFTEPEESEAFLLSEGQWSKSFCNRSAKKGRKQYFSCRFKKRCPARRAIWFRTDGSCVLYKTEAEHDHSGVKLSRIKRLSNINNPTVEFQANEVNNTDKTNGPMDSSSSTDEQYLQRYNQLTKQMQ
jgi:hypothetical protein